MSTFLSCDWGTSQFRLRLVHRPTGESLGEICSSDGVGRLSSAAEGQDRAEIFRATLARNVATLAEKCAAWPSDCPIVISGMASSSIGWRELPYATLPFALDGRDVNWTDLGPLNAGGTSHPVHLLSGVRGEWEIMRGEETQILGLSRLVAAPLLQREAILVLPGTHSKHVHVKEGAIADFQTYLTGELFEVLVKHSILRHSVTGPGDEGSRPAGRSDAVTLAFKQGVELSRDHPLSGLLFRARTRQVLHGCEPAGNRAFLSGLLIGSEIHGLMTRFPGAVPVVLCGGASMADEYAAACIGLGLEKRLHVVAANEVERLSGLGQAVVLDRLEFA